MSVEGGSRCRIGRINTLPWLRIRCCITVGNVCVTEQQTVLIHAHRASEEGVAGDLTAFEGRKLDVTPRTSRGRVLERFCLEGVHNQDVAGDPTLELNRANRVGNDLRQRLD